MCRVSYTSDNSYGAFLDTGSNAYYVLDPATLTSLSTQTGVSSVTNCADNGYYCMSSNLNLPITLAGSNGTTSPTETLSMESADTLLNSTDAALDDLGDTSCSLTTTLSCGAFDGLFRPRTAVLLWQNSLPGYHRGGLDIPQRFLGVLAAFRVGAQAVEFHLLTLRPYKFSGSSAPLQLQPRR